MSNNDKGYPLRLIAKDGSDVTPHIPPDFMEGASPHIAPEGKIWVCMTCFDRAKHKLDLLDICWEDAILCDEVQPAPGFYAVSEPTRD